MAGRFEKIVSIKLHETEDHRNIVFPLQQKRNHSEVAVCLRFLFVFSLDLHCTKTHFESNWTSVALCCENDFFDSDKF